MKTYRHTGNSRRRSGSTIVEFALIVPVLITFLLGIMEFGWLVKNHLNLSNATREGARAAAIGKTTSEIQTRVANMAAPLSVASPYGSVVMTQSADNGSFFTPWPADFNGRNGVMQGKLIKITSTARHNALTGFFPFLKTRNIIISVTMRREA